MQNLQAETRTRLGRKAAAMRKQGILPAVVYGEKVPSQAIAVPLMAFERVWRSAGESTLLELRVGDTSHTVLIHDVSYDPITTRPTHADFYAVRMDKHLRVKVPITFDGESPAVKNEGGILVKVVQELEIEAMPGDLPHNLTADLSLLKAFGNRILVHDIPAPKGVKILASPDEVVAIVDAPRSDEELAALNEAVGAVAEVKTERETEKEAKAEAEAAAEETEKK